VNLLRSPFYKAGEVPLGMLGRLEAASSDLPQLVEKIGGGEVDSNR